MTLNDDDRSPFRAPPATEASDGPRAADGSDEAMHRLRHPFAVPPADEPGRTGDAKENDR